MEKNRWLKTRPKYMDNLVYDKSNILNQEKKSGIFLNGTIMFQVTINSKKINLHLTSLKKIKFQKSLWMNL